MIRLPATRRRRIMLTPLIDVVFLLVMFFMLSSTFVPLRRLDVGIASGSAADAAPAGDNATLFLTIDPAPGPSGIAATLDGTAVPAGGLEAALRARAAGTKALVLLRLRTGTDVQDLVTALEAVRASGIGSVRVLTR